MDEDMEGGMAVDEYTQPLPGHRRLEQHWDAGRSPFELLRESKSSVEDIVARILAVKRDGLPKFELRELVTQIFLHFVTLRRVNRLILLEEDCVKAETERAKASVDSTTLQLHNLIYEKSHYKKAIKACSDFRSNYPDIELVSEEEFFCDALEDIKVSVASNDAHSLMLKRLNFELFQRKELSKLHEQLEQHKKSLLQTIADRKKFSSSLPSHVKSLKKACLPVQNQLRMLHSKKLKQQHHSAELLPPPLYLVFSQLVAQKEAFEEKIDLEIVGNVKDAQALIRQQVNKDSGISSSQESTMLEDDVPDEDNDGQRRKRPKNVPAKENLEHAGCDQVHPLKVILHIYDDKASDLKSVKLVSLKFEYMLKVNVVCVGLGTEGSNKGPHNDILSKLFPDDTGLELPHQSAKLAVGDNLKFDMNTTSRPYKWAQHLAGIHFLPEVPPLLNGLENANEEMSKSGIVAAGLSQCRQQNRVETIIQRIRSGTKAQLALL